MKHHSQCSSWSDEEEGMMCLWIVKSKTRLWIHRLHTTTSPNSLDKRTEWSHSPKRHGPVSICHVQKQKIVRHVSDLNFIDFFAKTGILLMAFLLLDESHPFLGGFSIGGAMVWICWSRVKSTMVARVSKASLFCITWKGSGNRQSHRLPHFLGTIPLFCPRWPTTFVVLRLFLR